MTVVGTVPSRRTVVLEMLGLVPGQIGGMETYARNLARVLPALDSRRRYLAVVGAEARGISMGGDGRLEEWIADARLPSWARRPRALRTILQSVALARRLPTWAPEIVHCMLMFLKPPWGARNLVVTIHDLNFELLPECWSVPDRLMMRWSCRLATRLAAEVLTVSEFSRRMLVQTYPIAADRIHVTPHGIEKDLFRPSPDPRSAEASRRHLGLPSAFLFFPANTWPHKNHRRLLEALAVLRKTDGLRPCLVLAGAPKHAHASVMDTIATLALGDQVRWLGYVERSTLAALYRTATALVFPSLHEGFGLPILEAMASGCPVACARTTGTGETAGDAALTFDPVDPGDIARAIRAMLENQTLRQDLARRGLARAAEFSWDRTARQTLRVYDEVAARQSRS